MNYPLEQLSEELRDLKFNKVIDGYVETGRLSAESYQQCTVIQKLVIQVLKRSFKRIISKDG